jgi:hypothetical protein
MDKRDLSERDICTKFITPPSAQGGVGRNAANPRGWRLNELGGHETKASIANKLSRGQFSAIFFVDTLKAIGTERIALEEI